MSHMPATRPIAAITGASAGIGATFARTLAARGHDLILIARRPDRLEALAAELAQRNGAKSEIIAADLTAAADLERVAERLAAVPELAILVNNAGFGVSRTVRHRGIRGPGRHAPLACDGHAAADARGTRAAWWRGDRAR
jgi:short-subunit dehydrogenase